MSRTVAEVLGNTPHLSPLLRKVRRLGFGSATALVQLAVARGCLHYQSAEPSENQSPDPGQAVLSDLEVAIALCAASQTFDPIAIRCAAQLISGSNISATEAVKFARMERCAPVIAHIAQAGAELDREDRKFWREILQCLASIPPPAPGVLPHKSRFVVHSGIIRRDRANQIIWLRPARTGK